MNYTYLVLVIGDTNDADYVTEEHTFNEEEFVEFKEKFQPLFDMMPRVADKNSGHNWFSTECRDYDSSMYGDLEELAEDFSDYVPYGEYGVHTIENIKVYKVSETTTLL